jgi:asparagine synthase (glutamine-hydrolysing)
MCENLYGVFAFILFDTKKKTVYFGRDTYGVRPAFKVYSLKTKVLAICSEVKGLQNVQYKDADAKVEAVLPGTFEEYQMENGKAQFVRAHKFHQIGNAPKYDVSVTLGADIYENIRNCLTNAIRMRLMSHRRIGCLLSGGLDSSIVTGIMVQEARKAGINYPIQTFSIGMDGDSPDILAARKVAQHLNTEHHEVLFSAEDAINAIRDVVWSLESYDVTTIRASIGRLFWVLCL